MALDTDSAFRFLQVNYKYGSLDKLGYLVGEALDELMLETGTDMEDLINHLESVGDGTLDKLEKVVPVIFKFMPLLANEHATKFQSKLLDIPLFQCWISAFMRLLFRRMLGLKSKGKPSTHAPIEQTAGGDSYE